MRFISATIAAMLLAVLSFGVNASPVASSAQGVKSESTFELIKKKKKSAKKAKKGKKKAKKGKKAKKAKKGAGRCGTMMYYSKGKCVSASEEKKKK